MHLVFVYDLVSDNLAELSYHFSEGFLGRW